MGDTIKRIGRSMHEDLETLLRASLNDVRSTCMESLQAQLQDLSIGTLSERLKDLEQQFTKNQIQWRQGPSRSLEGPSRSLEGPSRSVPTPVPTQMAGPTTPVVRSTMHMPAAPPHTSRSRVSSPSGTLVASPVSSPHLRATSILV